MPFYQEKQIEEWLETETRDLPMPDGSTQPLTGFKLLWSKVDSLVLLNGYARLELVEFALEEVRLQNVSFDKAFTGVVAYLDNERRKAWGID